jgi:CubicO group peptidase (beta-lactamase class C family)
MLRPIKSLRNILVKYKITIYVCFAGFLLTAAVIAFASSNKQHIVAINTTASHISKDTSTHIYVQPATPIADSAAAHYKKLCDDWYTSFLGTKGFNGGMIVAKDGNIVFEKYQGTVRIPGKDYVDENTPMQIASTSKTFTAMAVLKLWQDGKLDLDDPLIKYFPGFNYSGVTIRTLLNHRSGLPNYLYFMEQKGWNQAQFVHNQDVLDWMIKYKYSICGVAPADKHFRYCNTNFALLALVVEKVTGKTFPQYLKETFFDPLHMKHTFVFDPQRDVEAAPSYDYRGKIVHWNSLDAVYGDKNVYTTPRDLLLWDRALSVGNLFTPATLEAAYTPYSNETHGMKNYGLGWRMNIYPNGKKMIYHNGWWHGSNAAFIRLVEDTATIIIISNKYNRNVYKAKKLAPIFGNYLSGNDVDDNENPDTFVEQKCPVRGRWYSKGKRTITKAKTGKIKTTRAKKAKSTVVHKWKWKPKH